MKLLERLKIQNSCEVHFSRMSFRLRDNYENSGTARNTINDRTKYEAENVRFVCRVIRIKVKYYLMFYYCILYKKYNNKMDTLVHTPANTVNKRLTIRCKIYSSKIWPDGTKVQAHHNFTLHVYRRYCFLLEYSQFHAALFLLGSVKNCNNSYA
jgi:hypothetical protein